MADSNFAYGYHWWLPPNLTSGGAAMGVHGQFVIISPRTDLVFACVSAWPTAFDPARHNSTLQLFSTLNSQLR